MSSKNTDNHGPLVQIYDPAKAVAGCLKVATIRGIAVYLHWTLPVGGLLISLIVGFNPLEAMYYAVALSSLIAFHELGHIVAARYLDRKVFALYLAGLGGHCIVQRPTGVRETLILYCAGFAAQLILFVGTVLVVRLAGPPTNAFAACVVDTFTVTNFFVAVVSLLPYEFPDGTQSDGGVLLKLFWHVKKGHPHPFPNFSEQSVLFPSDTKLLNLESMVWDDFTTGIQILNDDSTPMEFVVSMLGKHLGMEREKAIQKMLKVHIEGGLLVPVESMMLASEIAAGITADARAAGHVLSCQAVERANE
jgi:ATP-dependent Clp protease adapter protein ClpS